MPTHVEGKKIVEDATGKVVGKSKTVKKAKSASRIRNWAHAAKKKPNSKTAQAFKEFQNTFGD